VRVNIGGVSHPLLDPPRFEGALRLPGGRRLGYAEFGPATGKPLLWFHGTPGARRQISPQARALAHERGVRIVSVERPGIGESTPHVYETLLHFARDIEQLCDALGIERFGVVGLSGGGPYALACAHELPGRVVAAAVLGGVAPAVGPDAAPGGASALIRIFAPWVRRARQPVGGMLRGLIRLLEPLADPAVDLFARQMPPGDQRLFEDPAVELQPAQLPVDVEPRVGQVSRGRRSRGGGRHRGLSLASRENRTSAGGPSAPPRPPPASTRVRCRTD